MEGESKRWGRESVRKGVCEKEREVRGEGQGGQCKDTCQFLLAV